MLSAAGRRHTSSSAPRRWTAEVAGEVLQEGDRVMHPSHGVGRVEHITVEVVSGVSLELVHVVFDETRLVLRVPTAKVRSIGLRRLASRALLDEALAVLRGRAKQGKGMWSRRAQEYQAKVNSGDPRLVAEVVRDLGRTAASGAGSFSERQLHEAALDRFAGEVAAVEGVDKEAAVATITAQLAPAAG